MLSLTTLIGKSVNNVGQFLEKWYTHDYSYPIYFEIIEVDGVEQNNTQYTEKIGKKVLLTIENDQIISYSLRK